MRKFVKILFFRSKFVYSLVFGFSVQNCSVFTLQNNCPTHNINLLQLISIVIHPMLLLLLLVALLALQLILTYLIDWHCSDTTYRGGVRYSWLCSIHREQLSKCLSSFSIWMKCHPIRRPFCARGPISCPPMKLTPPPWPPNGSVTSSISGQFHILINLIK